MRRLLLDTNVVVWLLLNDRDEIPELVVGQLMDEDNAVSVSAVSSWEIAIKRSLGKLDIEPDWARAVTRLDFNQMPVTIEHAAQCENLPWHHRDPFDRMLIAQAMVEEHAIVSADGRLAEYDVEVVW